MFANNFKVQTQFQNNVKTKKKKKSFTTVYVQLHLGVPISGLVGSADFPNERQKLSGHSTSNSIWELKNPEFWLIHECPIKRTAGEAISNLSS